MPFTSFLADLRSATSHRVTAAQRCQAPHHIADQSSSAAAACIACRAVATLSTLFLSLLCTLERSLDLLLFLLGSEATGCGCGCKGGVLLGRRSGAELSRVGRHADSLVRREQGHGVRIVVVLLAVVHAAVVAVHLCRSSRLCGVAVLAGQRGQFRHRVAIRLRLDHLDERKVFGQLERRVRSLRRVDVAALRALEQAEEGQQGESSGGTQRAISERP